jgi:glycosyltransferase involved in cell wall biosynthesis
MKYVINGRFLTKKLSGQERFAREMLLELDKICKPGELEVVTPEYAKDIPAYKNIKVIKYGKVKSHFWEQISLFNYLVKNKATGVNLCTTCPLLKPDINTIHDISMTVNSGWYTNLYGRLSRIWHGLMKFTTFHFAKKVLTVSNFSKSEMIRVFKAKPESIFVLGAGWQHYKKVGMDDTVFDRVSCLKKGEYYFAASSLTPQKNFKWLHEAARQNPNCLFAVAGKVEGLSVKGGVNDKPENMIYLGFVSDEEMKSLMANCKAFIHPALYEGFGLTPMEALSVGAELIISNAACLPEIYGKSAHYIDPYNADVDLEELLKQPLEPAENVLDNYSWEKFAKMLYVLLKEMS